MLPPTVATPVTHAIHLSPDALNQKVQAALDAITQGKPIVLLDDYDRENEADLIIAASTMTVETMAMFIRECSGIVCLCLPKNHVEQLGLSPMVANNQSPYGTAFTTTIEAAHGVSTGVSAQDRLTTIQSAARLDSGPADIISPGHVFPLIANEKGVLGRRGHTEGSVDLARLAGLPPFGVLCELTNPDGSMSKGQEVWDFALKHDLPILSIDELVAYRLHHGV